MKVAFTKEAKEIITLAQAPEAKKVIEYMKDDTGLKDYAEMAARVAGGNDSYEILKATAEIALNADNYDVFWQGSGHLDVYLKIYAFNAYKGFFDIGVYLSDVWQICGDNTDEIKSRMYINHYKMHLSMR